ncbi:IST1 homolog isoform X1 [Homarus americanus]|uniref:IST1 homolog isoform X1 n=1 Tax=Homarus americanus TaxID=6706 RepID=UPI001C4664DD|nr:IST1 homolog isoform X1 [Homarus americanus]
MFASRPNYNKLKTNLRLVVNRLKLLEKKKTELAQKTRKEIADYLITGKTTRAKIRVEQIIREDYLVEALELTEMYCDLLLSRFGLVQQLRGLDEGLAEAISSLLWVCPRLQTDVPELREIDHHLTLKYGKPFVQACREQQIEKISKRLINKLSIHAPSKVLVEKYLIEIAKTYDVEYQPDPQVMGVSEGRQGHSLFDLGQMDDLGVEGAEGGVTKHTHLQVKLGLPPSTDPSRQPYTPPPGCVPGGGHKGAYNIPPEYSGPDPYADPKLDKMYNDIQHVNGSGQWDVKNNSPPPAYSSHPMLPMTRPNNAPNVPHLLDFNDINNFLPDVTPDPEESEVCGGGEECDLPELPAVPWNESSNTSQSNEDVVDFDDLAKRFENLKRK